MRLLSIILFSSLIFAQPQIAIKTWYDKINETTYTFYEDQIVKEQSFNSIKDTVLLNPIPIDYPDYSSIWYDGALHLTSKRGGLVYRVEKDTTIRIDRSFQHRKQFQASQFVHRDTLFRYGGYGFWRANNFFTYFDKMTKEWEYYRIDGFQFPPEAYGGPCFLLGDTFYSFGGREVDKFTGLGGQKNNDIWTFDFTTRKWTNLGKTAVNLSPYKIVQKDSLFYLFGHPQDTDHNLLVDLNNNQARFYKQSFTSANISKNEPAFFRGDSLYYYKNNILYSAVLSENIFNNPQQVERLFFDQRTLFTNLTFVALLAFVIIALSYLWITYQRIRAPRLVRGGIRNNFDFYPLREEEELVLGLLQSKLSATTEDILRVIGREELSNSQNNKRKADAIVEINKLMKQLVGKTIIKTVKDPNDKRQVIYYYKRNLLN
ncbi:MAG: hypothetical protein ACPH4O_04590 [Flavobacteriaceae bacterium]